MLVKFLKLQFLSDLHLFVSMTNAYLPQGPHKMVSLVLFCYLHLFDLVVIFIKLIGSQIHNYNMY